MKSEKFYIVYFKSITQYHTTNKGYYVGYKNKIEDEYSDNFIFAKRYKSLAPALNRAYINYKGANALNIMKKIESGEDYFSDSRIEVIKIVNLRKRKLSKLNGENSDPIRNLGTLSKNEYYDFLKKESDKIDKFYKVHHIEKEDIKTATEEDIDDFCSHMDNLKIHE